MKHGHRAAKFGNYIFLLCGVQSVNYDVNCAFFREVQSFIITTNLFSVATVTYPYICKLNLVFSAICVCCLYVSMNK